MKYLGKQIVSPVSEGSEKIEFLLVRSYLMRSNTEEISRSNAEKKINSTDFFFLQIFDNLIDFFMLMIFQHRVIKILIVDILLNLGWCDLRN